MTTLNLIVVLTILSSIGLQLRSLKDWKDALTPSFIGTVLCQVTAAVAALLK